MRKLMRILRALIVIALLGVAAPIVVQPATAAAMAEPVVINEFLAKNGTTLADNTGAFPDWIELHNTSASTVNLENWTLADGSNNFVFPAGTTIAGGQYLVVFASGDVARTVPGEIHLPFKLAGVGESLTLTDSSGIVTDPGWPAPVEYPVQIVDDSYGLDSNGVIGYFTDPTPGAANGGSLAGLVDAVTFSVGHGYYTSSQSVVLDTSTAGATIRYTTNGDAPTASNGTALVPGQSITVSNTTTLRAVAYRDGWVSSSIETRSYFFTSDVIAQSGVPAGFPSGEVNGQKFDYGMDPDVVAGNEAAVAAALTAIPTISIVTDVDNLFDPTTGIYVNATNRGRSWERPASVELIDPSGAETGFDIEAGIRMRGGFSRNDRNPKHSWRLFFRGEYEGALDYPLFGDQGPGRFEKVDLRTSQNYAWHWRRTNTATFIDEVWSRDTQAAMGQPHTRSRQYHVYLNGTYWGIYMTQERVSGDYGEQYFGETEDDYDVVKRAQPSNEVEATDGTDTAWRALFPLVSDLQVSETEYADLDAQVDMVALADYYLLHFYTGDFDGSPSWFFGNDGRWSRSNNWYAVRNRNGVGAAAKWQFFDHDSEHSLCANGGPNVGVNIDNTPPWNLDATLGDTYMTPAFLHEALLTHPSYRQIFTNRVRLHLGQPGGSLTEPANNARLDLRVAEVTGAIAAESARWGDGEQSAQTAPYGHAEWQNAVQLIRDCFTTRPPVVEAQLRADGLWPTDQNPNQPPVVDDVADQAVVVGDLISLPMTGSDPEGDDLAWSATGLPIGWVIDGVTGVISGVNAEAGVVSPTITLTDALGATATTDFEVTAAYPVPSRMILNEWNAVDNTSVLADGDSFFGTVPGNGGDWFELVVTEDLLDIRGWTLEISDTDNDEGTQQEADTFEFADSALLADLRAGTIITVSEDLADDVSYDPAGGDWWINLQANSADEGSYFTADTQSNFGVNNKNWQLIIRDNAGQPVFGPAGEGAAGLGGVSGSEIGELEADPSSAITPASLYDDGNGSTFGSPNGFDGGFQDFTSLRPEFEDTTAPDGVVTSPTRDLVIPDTAVTITGTASDDVGVATVGVAFRDRDNAMWLRSDGSLGLERRFIDATVDSPGQPDTTWSLPIALAEGSWGVTVRAEDTSGNRDATLPWVRFEVKIPNNDTTAPDAVVTSPTRDLVFPDTAVTITGTASDDVGVAAVGVALRDRDNGVWLRSDGSFGTTRQFIDAVVDNPGQPDSTWSLPITLAEGSWGVTVRAEDTNGNRDATLPWVRFEVEIPGDTTNPDGAVTSPTRDQLLNVGLVTVTGTASDDIGVAVVGVAVRDRDNGLWLLGDGSFGTDREFMDAAVDTTGQPNVTWTFPITLAEGNWAVNVRVEDTSGNRDTTLPWVRFEVGTPSDDTVAPDAAVTTPTMDQVFVDTTVPITGTATDDVGVAKVGVAIRNRDSGLWLRGNGTFGSRQFLDAMLDSPDQPSTNWTFPITLATGNWSLEVRAEDAAGNRDTTLPFVRFEVAGAGVR